MNIDETEILLDPRETHRSEVMALGRTVMANERTFLAFFRMALGLAAAGGGILQIWEHPFLRGLGITFIAASVIITAMGVSRYLRRKKSFEQVVALHASER